MAFFHYRQNNSGGSFDVDSESGISVHVLIEAAGPDEANAKAQRIGLYFDGADDCPCCGDRWHPMSLPYDKGDSEPRLYGNELFSDYKAERPYLAPQPEGFVHYADGRVVPFGAAVTVQS